MAIWPPYLLPHYLLCHCQCRALIPWPWKKSFCSLLLCMHVVSIPIILVLCLEALQVTGALLKLCYIKLSCKPFSVLNTFMRFLISIPASKPTGSFSKNSGTDIPSLMSFARLWKSLISTYRENNDQKIMLEQSQRGQLIDPFKYCRAWQFKPFLCTEKLKQQSGVNECHALEKAWFLLCLHSPDNNCLRTSIIVSYFAVKEILI